jgi:hypothetical protein
MKEAVTFCDHLVSFAAISYALWPLGIFCGYSGMSLQIFGMLATLLRSRNSFLDSALLS